MRNIKRNGQKNGMLQQEKNGVEYLTFPAFSECGIVNHSFSTRIGGVSEGIFSTMNFSFTRGDREEDVRENYRRMAGVLECELTDFVCSDQTHTTNIRHVTREDGGKGVITPKDYTDIDGLMTNEPGLVLVTFYADCVPLYFVDPVNKAIGLAHSGWKGTVHRMGREMVCAMGETFGTKTEDLLVAIGPSICQDCYEVSRDVAEQFIMEFPEKQAQEEILYETIPGEKYQLNLQRANAIIFEECGIPKEQISVTDICTCCNPEYLFSHRASQGKRGNLAAFLGLRKY